MKVVAERMYDRDLRRASQTEGFSFDSILTRLTVRLVRVGAQHRFWVAIASVLALLSYSAVNYLAAEEKEVQILLELNPLDWTSLSHQRAIQRCTAALANAPKLELSVRCRLLFLRGMALSFAGKTEDAVQDLTELLKHRPDDYQARQFRGQMYGTLGQYEKAHADFAEMVRLQPRSATGYACMALYSHEVGDIGSCKKYADKAIALDRGEPAGYLCRALSYLKEHNTKQALEDLGQCIALSYGMGTPASATPYSLRAALLIGVLDQPMRGLSDMLMARRLNPSDPAVKGLFWSFYFKTGKYHLAFQISEQLMQECPSRPDMLASRVRSLLVCNKYEESRQVAQTLIALAPKLWFAYYHRGQVSFARKQYEAALRDYDKALTLHTDNLPVMGAKAYLLATCPDERFRDGKTARTLAIRCCERTENQAPRYLMFLAMAHAECGDFGEAVRLAKLSLEKAEPWFPFLEDYRRRLTLFQQRKPFRFTPESPAFDYLTP